MARLEFLPASEFDQIAQFVESACEGDRGGHTPQQCRDAALRGDVQLWRVLAGDETLAAVVTQLRRRPVGIVCDIVICTGRERERWEHLVADLEQWARSMGCVAMDVSARPGWKRLLKGYEMTHVQLWKDL